MFLIWDLLLNSKLLILILAWMLAACGVKGNPVAPRGADIPSVMEKYPDIQLESPLQENPRPRRARRQ
jgi:predicted small lipoprotein YifL